MPATPLAIPYSSSSADYVYAASYTAKFEHPDPTNCPVTACTLKATGCGSAMATSTNFYLANSGVAPYAISAKQNIVAGWTAIDFCYSCTG